MEYVYAALLLNATGKEVKEDTVKGVIAATGAKPDDAKIKALVASLEGVNIEEAISKAAVTAAPAAAPAQAGEAPKEEKKEEEPEVSEEEAASGLSALFG